MAGILQMHFTDKNIMVQFEYMTSVVILYASILAMVCSLAFMAQQYFKPNQSSLFISPFIIFYASLILLGSIIIFSSLAIAYGFYKLSSNGSHNSPQNIEITFAFIFNGLFFASQMGISRQVSVTSFWRWIQNHCPSELQQSVCVKKFVYSPSNCAADWNICNSTSDGLNFACPYSICRQSVLAYGKQCLMYLCIGAIFVVILEVITFIAACASLQVLMSRHKDRKSSFPFFRFSSTSNDSADTHDSGTTRQSYGDEAIRDSRSADSHADYEEECILRV